jgi:hypothetical protein
VGNSVQANQGVKVMFQSRTALNRAIRLLAQTVERSGSIRAASAEFCQWLDTHKYSERALPVGNRSRTIAWTAAEAWPGSVEWYILDETVIGLPEYRGLFYEIPFADLARMPSAAPPETVWSERRHRAAEARDR